ncbi:MAG TPA: B12-binding domain-containing radical SAM protein [Thermoanaerobaculia bacterium]|nr:B12-binding domain-containing radical SAM protein [Thermoanaerobaculia bacterium]
MTSLRVVVVKPSKYATDGFVERFRRGFMPNSTVPHLASMTPREVGGFPCEVATVDEYVETSVDYFRLFDARPGERTLVALVGVQSHQLHRALDLAALAVGRGALAVIGGPHPMTCDTTMLQGRGVAFALSEAEIVWPSILEDALAGELRPVYGREQRWAGQLEPPVLRPASRRDLRRYAVPMLGVYPARGCPYSCNFCSVIKIAGHRLRSQPVETTLASLRAAKKAGVRFVMFTSDNFNKYPEVGELLDAMIAERIELPFFAQCDAQIHRQEDLVERMARAGCHQIFVGAESFSSETLRAAHKFHNDPGRYAKIVALCRENGITSHFSNILGFPQDTESGILRHLSTLRELGPDVASFYILTPIPGTEQYEDFLRDGWITESNLDRYDGTCVTWRHPNLANDDLRRLLFHCYRVFYRGRDVASKLARLLRGRRDFRLASGLFAVFGLSAMSRLAAARRLHPMAGGIGRVRRDGARDYAALRRSFFGFDYAPLPANLALSKPDEELNRRAKLG